MKSYDYKQLDFVSIRNILRVNWFLTENQIDTLESSLKTAENIDVKQGKGYDEERLMSELCDAFTNENDHVRPSRLTQILIHQLKFTDSNKRQRFYDVLLHNYFTLNELNPRNVEKILHLTIKQNDDLKLDSKT
eukprot:1034791_1